MKELFLRVIRLAIFGVVTFMLLKATTFGWKTNSYNLPSIITPQIKQLQNRLKEHVYKLSYYIGDRNMFSSYENLSKAQDYIAEQLITYGYKVSFQEYMLYNKKVRNVVAIKRGKMLPGEVILLGAHYDTCFNPGADDNASGVAGILELARLIVNKETDKTVEFVAFVNEEPPNFKSDNMGSKVYAMKAKAEKKNIAMAIILESIGYYSDNQKYPVFLGPFFPHKGNFIAVIGNLNSKLLVNKVESIFKKYSSIYVESAALPDFISGIDYSDHWSFWQEGYPAVMITDTAFLRNHNYHKQSDCADTLDYEKMAYMIEGFSYALIDLANK